MTIKLTSLLLHYKLQVTKNKKKLHKKKITTYNNKGRQKNE